MKVQTRALIIGIAGLTTGIGLGQEPVITAYYGSGQLSWTNTINSNALYRIEWAADADGPWQRTFDNIGSLDGRNAAGFTVSVPMFFRVVMTTNQPPVGMVWIDGGDAELGQVDIATPVHTNFVSGFWMDATEVTKAQWDDVATWAASNGYDITVASAAGKTNNHPVQTVSWYDCVKWCNARSQKEGLPPCYTMDTNLLTVYRTEAVDINNAWVNWSADGYRLPTEAEWEKASRGGRQGRLFPWGGDTIQHARANYRAFTILVSYDTSPTQDFHPNYQTGGTPYTSPVGSFPANGYGLHDMTGNISEWCWDWYADYTADYQADSRGPVTWQYLMHRVRRGGTWGNYANVANCASRSSMYPPNSSHEVGFRCVKGP